MQVRAEIIVNGFVQGVGFRYFVYREALKLELVGYTKNLFTGEVLTIAEGEKSQVEELYKKIKIGPGHASVKDCKVDWLEPKNEFDSFDIR